MDAQAGARLGYPLETVLRFTLSLFVEVEEQDGCSSRRRSAGGGREEREVGGIREVRVQQQLH